MLMVSHIVPTIIRRMKLRTLYVYIVTNYANTALYIGVTNNLEKRLYEHRSGRVGSFTQRYKLTKLVYFESADTAEQAIDREKQLKNWHRDWKISLIQSTNPDWKDLSLEWA